MIAAPSTKLIWIALFALVVLAVTNLVVNIHQNHRIDEAETATAAAQQAATQARRESAFLQGQLEELRKR